MVWIGERTRQLDGAHVEFFSRIRNPIGVKLGPTTTPGGRARADRAAQPGQRARAGSPSSPGWAPPRSATCCPRWWRRSPRPARSVAWVCDPMHGNTFEAPSGHKTRRFDDVLDEVAGFFEVHRALGTHPGGIHVEFTGDDVTECVGGGDEIVVADLQPALRDGLRPAAQPQPVPRPGVPGRGAVPLGLIQADQSVTARGGLRRSGPSCSPTRQWRRTRRRCAARGNELLNLPPDTHKPAIR